ncbi:MAG: hypothetical protein WCP19_11625 [Chloroflexota bacterium]
MQKSTFNSPALFGDHHVTEVRRLLFSVPGVKQVYASSAFQVIQIEFDVALIKHDDLIKLLENEGYLANPLDLQENLPVPSSMAEMRHTATYAAMKKTISFSQKTPYSGRPLWNCPGMGVIKNMDE